MADQIAYSPSENPGVSEGELFIWKGHTWRVVNTGITQDTEQFAVMIVKHGETSNHRFKRLKGEQTHGKRSA